MDWIVVVPSYNRPTEIKHKTLALLEFHKIPKSIIHIFVANEEQRVAYRESIGDQYPIIVGEKGLPQIRNFIFNSFPKGTRIVSFDDDVKSFVKLVDGKLQPFLELELIQFIDTAFTECERTGAKLWGDYPVPNPFFMKSSTTTNLKFIIGSFWGCINPGNEIQITIGHGEKEDYMRTIQFWKRDGIILRFNYLSHRTDTYGGTGGLQSDGHAARLARETETVNKLIEMYPDLLYRNTRRKSPFPEILFRRKK